MPTVKYSVSAYIADGTTTDYLITWDYLDDDHITVEVDGLSNADPTASHTFTKLNDTTVRVTDGIGGAIAAGKEIQIRRNTPITTRPISFADGSALLAADLNKNSDYLLYSMQEALDQVDFTVQFQQEAEAFRDETEALRDATQVLRTEVGDDTADADAHRIAAALSETNAASSAANASTSETNAAASETAAQTAETGAAASAIAAAASKNAAAASEAAASASETAAATSETNAAASEAGVAADAALASSKASAAGISESNSLIYKNNAAASASNAQISESNASASRTAAANSAVQASNSENAAAISRNSAATYATNSQASAVASEASKVAAGLSESIASASAAAASASEINAAASEGNAASSEANALTYSSNAATSAASAASSAAALTGLNLDAISETIADTAVDVFVYDTRKDSDGGAWRKRTQGTSWYNETLNTATRGSRKEFPAVAVIVAESSQVTIYDGDDPDLPMWMVFNAGGGSFSDHTYIADSSSVDSLGFINAQMVVGNSSGYGIFIIDFLKETSECLRGSDEAGLRGIHTNVGIANRNTNSGEHQGTLKQLASNSINDVAMTVLPNAPIDAATGLPVPTIAVATAGGTSVIRDDGTVVDVMAGTTAYGVEFTKDHKLLHTANDANSTFSIHVRSIPSSDTTSPASRKYNHDGSGGFTTPPISGISNESTSKKLAILPNHTIASATLGSSTTGGKPALNLLQEVASAPTKGMVAYTTSTYNTGWMNGDIKLATLSDTDDTDVTGSELVTNGTFDSDISGWTDYSGAPSSISYSNGTMYLDGNTAYARATQTISTVVGKTYTFTLTASGLSSETFQMWVGTYGVYSSDIANKTFTDNGVSSLTFTATTTTTYITVFSGYNFYVDNVSVRLAEEDRSVNGNGLQVFGTVTKSAVATGADLVAYSGFSSSNYLVQPYNSDLDFGTGDFCVMGWIKTSTSGSGRIAHLQNTDGTVPYSFAVDVFSGGLRYFSYGADTSATTLVGGEINTNTWTFFAAKRASGTVSLWINGVLSTSSNISDPIGGNSNSYELGVGNDPYYALYPVDASLALFRISATAPSPEQILKIYNDEKHLFTEGAQATLYGSSDAVTALAYDDTTELLHVGTSAGRSVFQGLKRVDNTTTAVGAAISASNGLVADE